ncbi:MAG: DUF481 domain-containing protein [Verrucomicrobiota bacterium JB022]|nr:DUF481 domain-containing protein [Verrucomicrobiota bacterium JB022]
MIARPRSISSILALSAAVATGGSLRAAEITLSNGDKLTGEVLRIENETVYILSPILGEIAIPDLGVTIVYGENENVVVPLDQTPPPAAELVGPAEPEEDAVVTGEEIALAEAAAAEPAPEPATIVDPTSGAPIGQDDLKQLEEVWWHPQHLFAWLRPYYPLAAWNNSIDVGLTLEDNKTDKTKILLALETKRKFTDIELTLYGQYRYDQSKTQEGVTSTTEDKFETYFRYRHDISDRLFFQSRTDYKTDAVSAIDYEVQENLGVGYRWLDSERWKASITPSVGYQLRKYTVQEDDDQAIATLFQDLEYQISSRLKFKESATYKANLQNMEDYSLDFIAELENRLAAYLNLKLRYEWHFDQAIDGRIEKDQKIFNVTMGADF